ncbi:MAG TPA: hypothetical protein VF533_20685 [Solirubrobacteraceae bacterium]
MTVGLRRRRLGLVALVALLGAPGVARADQVSAEAADPRERPSEPSRDVERLVTAYDSAGTWTIALRLFGPVDAGSGFLRADLVDRDAGGACKWEAPSISIGAYADPAERGGRGYVDGHPVDLSKRADEDGRGFSVAMSDPALANRAVCGVARVSLSAGEPFDTLPDLAFPGAPAPPPRDESPADTTAPTAALKVARTVRRGGRVRVTVSGASEAAAVRVAIRGRRAEGRVRPGRALRLSVRLRPSDRRRLGRRGKLKLRVVASLRDEAGNTVTLRRRATVRRRS